MLVLILSGPSGSGKSSLCKKLLDVKPNFRLSVSVTTRKPRASEINEVDYKFVTQKDFADMQNKNEMIEAVEMYDNSYGTPKKNILQAIESGYDLIFDIDYRGAKIIENYLRTEHQTIKLATVYVIPPSLNDLKNRLILRGDNEESIKRRLLKAKEELKFSSEYMYILNNYDLTKAFDELNLILDRSNLV